jgi:DNA-binding NarL/FixJ family response regulator
VPRVLVADDDAAFRTHIEDLLAEHVPDADVVASVDDGHRAVAAALTHAPAIVVIDYSMPGPTGGHAAAVIRQALPGASVVVVSGLEREEAHDLPPDIPFVRKGPTFERELVAALAQRSSSSP